MGGSLSSNQDEFAQIVHRPENGPPRVTRMFMMRDGKSVRVSLSVWAPDTLIEKTARPYDVEIPLPVGSRMTDCLDSQLIARSKPIKLHDSKIKCTETLLFRGLLVKNGPDFDDIDKSDRQPTQDLTEANAKTLVYNLFTDAVRQAQRATTPAEVK